MADPAAGPATTDSRRRTFGPVVLLGLGFILATWNAEGSLGLPSTAVKSVLFPDQLSTRDRNSSIYRDLEAYNLWITVRASPLLGLGFGQPFIVAVPMPDISEFFEAWQYFPHNSIVWIWIKTGFFGFATMLYMFARTIQRGASRLATITSPDDLAMMVGALAYVVMFVVFAYVDIGWDIRPAIFLALCMAIVVDLPAEQHKRELRT